VSVLKLNVVIVAIVLVATAAFTWGLLLPGLDELDRKQEEIKAELAKVGQVQQEVRDVGALYASIQSLNAETRTFRERLPDQRRFGEFLNDLSQCLEKSKVTDYAIQPMPTEKVAVEQLPDNLKSAVGTMILPVHISFHSSFERVFGFLVHLESLRRVFHIETLELSNDPSQPGRVKAEMILHTYYQPVN